MNLGNVMYEEVPVTVAEKRDEFHSDFIYGMSTMQGFRRAQEDQAIYQPNLYKDYSYFAIFDGHNGAEVAVYLKRNFHKVLRKFLELQEPAVALDLAFTMVDLHVRTSAGLHQLQSIKAESEPHDDVVEKVSLAESIVKEICYALIKPSDDRNEAGKSNEELKLSKQKKLEDFVNIFAKDDSEDVESDGSSEENASNNKDKTSSLESENSDFEENVLAPTKLDKNLDAKATSLDTIIKSKANSSHELHRMDPGTWSGSTATVVLFSLNHIFVANVGDTRCIISSNNEPHKVSEDHKPTLKQEKKRIIQAGHEVRHGRIDGILNLSRTIGDSFLKKQARSLHQQAVVPVPFIREIKIDEKFDFLVLASDGIWNSMTNEDVVTSIEKRLKDKVLKLSNICEELSLECINHSDPQTGIGMDNISIMIIVPKRSCQFKNLPQYENENLSETSENTEAKRIKLSFDSEKDDVCTFE